MKKKTMAQIAKEAKRMAQHYKMHPCGIMKKKKDENDADQCLMDRYNCYLRDKFRYKGSGSGTRGQGTKI